MYESYILSRPWLVISIWAVLYISDYYLTLWGARLSRRQKFMVIEGSYELNPDFEKEVDRQQPMSVSFLVWLIGVSGVLLWTGSVFASHWVYRCLAGLFIIPAIYVHLRHLDNIALYRRLSGPDPGVSGSVTISRRNAYVRSSVAVAGFAALTLVLFLLVGSYFLLGGVFGLTLLAWNLRSMARRCLAPASKEQSE
jgi:hypothetical protein